jgi:hypothetical protein
MAGCFLATVTLQARSHFPRHLAFSDTPYLKNMRTYMLSARAIGAAFPFGSRSKDHGRRLLTQIQQSLLD